MINLAQLKAVMIFELQHFAKTGVTVDQNTKHSDILSTKDGLGNHVSSAAIYQSFVRFTLVENGNADKPWPESWLPKTVAELAPALL